jgi:hypothetical protein
MHQLGSGLNVSAGDAKLVDVPTWNFGDQTMVTIEPLASIPANAPISTNCAFNNTTSSTVHFGLHTSDEMCMVVLYYWPAKETGTLDMCLR